MLNIDNAEKAVDITEKAGSVWSKNPLGVTATLIIFAIIFTVWVTITVVNARNSDKDKQLEAKERQLSECGNKYDELVYELLIKNNIIQNQEQVIKEADSTIRETTEYDAMRLMNKKKRK